MVTIKQEGDWSKTTMYLEGHKEDLKRAEAKLSNAGQKIVDALRAATPVKTGKTAASWRYEVKRNRNSIELSFYNDNIQNGVPIAIIIQYGHATRNGGYVQGRDYINPAVQPIFDEIAKDLLGGDDK